MNRRNEKLQMTICTRLPVSKFRTLQDWCEFSFRKRSEVIAMVLERVLEMVEEQTNSRQPVEHVVRRLHLDPPQ
jgi:hypothetical protein